MQIDMHYYGTYAMARAAGLKREPAQIAASAAQFVDEMTGSELQGNDVVIDFKDGGSVFSRPTAHHPTHLIKNIDKDDQRQVWVPFHFLPGNEGKDFTERLQCRMHSSITNDMINHHANLFQRKYGLQLAGITAHVLGDTFSHYGFSGVSSRRNRIEIHSEVNVEGEILDYILKKKEGFWKKYVTEYVENIRVDIIGGLAEEVVAALGHGAAATYPDRPYLVWALEYEFPEERKGITITRDNPSTFLEGCKALYDLFEKVAAARPDDGENGTPFENIKEEVAAIIAVQAPKKGRIEAWQKAMERGAFGNAETIPPYLGEDWNKDHKGLDSTVDSTRCLDHEAYLFLQAASMHRNYILRDLLPAYELVVA